MGLDASLDTGASVNTADSNGEGGGDGGGPGTIVVDGTPGLFGDGSPGANLSQHVADPTHNGYMAAAQAQLVAALSGMDGWLASLWSRMQTIVPAINRAKRLGPLSQTTFTALAHTSIGGSNRIEGGGQQPLTTSTTLYSGEPLTQGIKGNSWAWGFEVNLAPPTTGHEVVFGIANPDDSGNSINLVTDFDGTLIGSHPNLHTNVFAWMTGTGSGSAIIIDTGFAVNNTSFKGVISSDGTTIKIDINGTNVVSQAVSGATKIVDGPACVKVFATASADLQLSDGLFGYVSPTPISP